jgi:DNA mismatch repair ATPase MutS
VRPKLTQHGPLAIVGGRHPLLEQQPDTAYQPNDTYLAGGCFLLVPLPFMQPSCILGCNGF